MRVLVTGGAGFVGSNLCVGLAEENPDWELVAFDNLRRRGSELILDRLRRANVEFQHGDVREPSDLDAAGIFDVLIECSAEPSVLAGFDRPEYSVQANLIGAYNCIEAARRNGAFLIFLSTSRVYPIAPQLELNYRESATRFELEADQPVSGVGTEGIAESFPMTGPRTLYGATKFGAELLIEEYAAAGSIQAVINRCGVIAGPWQLGKVDQGVFSWWLLSHFFERPLSYIGYQGSGKQVRDLLHIDDLTDLLREQTANQSQWNRMTVNVGGGRACSLSLLEATEICQDITGNVVPISQVHENRPGDVPIYLSDCSHLFGLTDWRPKRDPKQILSDLFDWTKSHHRSLAGTLGFG